ncbi:MAG: chemotaxis protein CheD [Candidatus Muirbacterium halophilum]|nr:chemotaxis protein CheD [Candidatus Muirbacterium halophilum]MCK9477293.1 chemotaxis protein CheD [Candidatus Muirbacterium halophilum]
MGITTTVGISDMAITKSKDDILITYSLGSCLGLTVYDPENNIGGLIHCLLPLAQTDQEKSKKNPMMFVETGVPILLQKIISLGAKKKNLVIKAAGCGKALNSGEQFNIGQRNFTVLRKIMWKNDILIKAKDVGGSKARTLTLNMQTGETFIKSGGDLYKI